MRSFMSTCDLVSGQCRCRPNVEGLKCDTCVNGTWNIYSGEGGVMWFVMLFCGVVGLKTSFLPTPSNFILLTPSSTHQAVKTACATQWVLWTATVTCTQADARARRA